MDRNKSITASESRQRKSAKSKKNELFLSYLALFFLPIFLFLCEFMLKISLFGSINAKEFFISLFFSFSIGITATVVCRAFSCMIAALAENRHVIRPLTSVLVGICSAAALILFLVQYVYFSFFGDFFK